MRRGAAAILILLCSSAAACGADRFPLPDFPSWYHMPQTTVPGGRAAWLAWLDAGFLAAALVSATAIALRWQGRTFKVTLCVLAGVYIYAAQTLPHCPSVFGLELTREVEWLSLYPAVLIAAPALALRYRRGGMVLLVAASLAYFGFYRGGCVCPIGAIQNVAESLATGSALPLAVLAFFLLPLAVALFAGRTFCAGVCPLGAMQDLVLLRPLKVPLWLEHVLGLGPWMYLGVAVLMAATGGGYLICRYDPFVDLFRLGGPANIIVFGVLVLVVGLFVGRPYCRFVCPYGALLRPLASVSWKHAKITPAECINCRLCEDSCPFNAIRKPTPPPSARSLLQGKGALVAALVSVPVLVLAGAWAMSAAAGALARANYTVRLSETAVMAERVAAAEKLIRPSPITAGGMKYELVAGRAGRAVVEATWHPKPLPASEGWTSEPLAPAAALNAPGSRAGLAISADGQQVWTLLKYRTVENDNPTDVYTIVFFYSGSGRAGGQLVSREEGRLDVNMARAFADTGLRAADLVAQADAVKVRILWGCRALGAFLGLVIALKLVQLSVRRTRKEFEIDRARCVSCGRCFRYCPVQCSGQVKGALGAGT